MLLNIYNRSPAKSPAKSPGKGPAVADANRIELKKDSNGLGLSIVGGSDTPLVSQLFVFKAALRHAFSACVYCMRLRFQSNYVGWLKPK
jgi:hypothetical protein